VVEEGDSNSVLNEYRLATVTLCDALRDGCESGRFGKFAFASLDYLSLVTGGKRLTSETKGLTMAALLLGVKINDYDDVGTLSPRDYMGLLRGMRKDNPERYEDFRKYRRKISRLEKNRPNLQALARRQEGGERATIEYRQAVNHLSLAFCCSVAFNKPLASFLGKDKPNWFDPFFNLVMASQVIDDYIGREGDLLHNRPSFYTMLCSPQELASQSVRSNMKKRRTLMKLFLDYVKRSKDSSPGFLRPIRSAVAGLAAYPAAVGLVRSVPSLDKAKPFIMSKRDRNDL